MFVEHVAHEPEVLDVVVVPEARGDTVCVIGLGMDRAVFGAAGAVTALGLHGAEIGLAHRLLRPEAVAVRDLVEAVLHRLRAQLDGLEEDVVLGVTRHASQPPLDGRGEPRFSNRCAHCASSRGNEEGRPWPPLLTRWMRREWLAG